MKGRRATRKAKKNSSSFLRRTVVERRDDQVDLGSSSDHGSPINNERSGVVIDTPELVVWQGPPRISVGDLTGTAGI